MRISTNMFHSQGVTSIQSHQGDVLDMQLKLSTGKRVNAPGDDPVAMNQIHSLNRTMNTIDQYAKNGEYAKTQLVLEETAITDTIDSIQRARELSIQMLNGTYSDDDKASTAAEIDEIVLQVKNMMNFSNSEGELIFAGSSVFAEAAFVEDVNNPGYYAYIGSANAAGQVESDGVTAVHDPLANYGSRFVQIGFDADNKVNPDDQGDSSRVRITDNGANVFAMDASLTPGNLDSTTGVDNNILNVLVNLSNLLKGNASEPIAVENGNPANTAPTLDDIVGQMDNAIDNMSKVLAEIGGRQNRIESQYNAGEAFKLSLEEQRLNLEEMDIVEGVTELTKSQNALQMAQQVFTRVQDMSLFNYLR
jgi:flagellar hook-associated protein 3 FlgL